MQKISCVELDVCVCVFSAVQKCRTTCVSDRRGGCLTLLLHIHKAKKKKR